MGLWTENPAGLAIVGMGMSMQRSKREIAMVLKRAGYILHHEGDSQRLERSLGWHIGKRRNTIRFAAKETEPEFQAEVTRALDEAAQELYERARTKAPVARLPRTRNDPSVSAEAVNKGPVRPKKSMGLPKPSDRDLRYERAFIWPTDLRFAYYSPDGGRTSSTLTPEEYLATYRDQRFLWQRKGEPMPTSYPKLKDAQDTVAAARRSDDRGDDT